MFEAFQAMKDFLLFSVQASLVRNNKTMALHI